MNDVYEQIGANEGKLITVGMSYEHRAETLGGNEAMGMLAVERYLIGESAHSDTLEKLAGLARRLSLDFTSPQSL